MEKRVEYRTETYRRAPGTTDAGRVQRLEAQIAGAQWKSALFVCHGGVNRAMLAWVLGAGPELLPCFEQDNACMNIIDIDCDPATGEVVRRFVRAVNWTPYDASKRDIHLTTLEATAVALGQRPDTAGDPSNRE